MSLLAGEHEQRPGEQLPARPTLGDTDSHTTDGRVDHRFNTDNSIFARYSYNNLDT